MSHNETFGYIKVGDTYMDKVDVGTLIKFRSNARRFNRTTYTVQASNRFYSVCTKPLNMIKRLGGGKYAHEKTVLYTIIDWYNQLRGTENLMFGMGAETKKDCEEMLDRLTNAKSDISSRNWCKLDIEKIVEPKKKHGKRS